MRKFLSGVHLQLCAAVILAHFVFSVVEYELRGPGGWYRLNGWVWPFYLMVVAVGFAVDVLEMWGTWRKRARLSAAVTRVVQRAKSSSDVRALEDMALEIVVVAEALDERWMVDEIREQLEGEELCRILARVARAREEGLARDLALGKN